MNVVHKLGDIIEMVDLSWCVGIGIGGESTHKWLVVGEHVECMTFHKVTKMLDCQVGQVDCQQFTVKFKSTSAGFNFLGK